MTPSHATILLANEAATLAFGAQLASLLHPGDVVFLEGPLGAGKTTLTRGLLRGFHYTDKVKSPTYTLVEPYEAADKTIYHFDLYRLRDPEELEHLGARDYFTKDAICIVEWPDKGRGYLPVPDVICHLSIVGEARTAQVESHSSRGQQLLKQVEQLATEG